MGNYSWSIQLYYLLFVLVLYDLFAISVATPILIVENMNPFLLITSLLSLYYMI